MNAAIIAAGEGSRLKSEGIEISKPLIKVGGVPMIERLIRCAIRSKVRSISVIINEEMADVREFCEHLPLPIPLNLLVRSTPSSMHSLFALAPYLDDRPFYLMTVDTVFLEDEFDKYLAFAKSQSDSAGILAVTSFIDDEKPLCVRMDRQHRIREFSDIKEGYEFATGGIYYFSPKVFDLIPECLSSGTVRLRNFLRSLIAHGYTLHGYPFSKIIDIDHASDIAVAEEFLKTEIQN